MFLCLVFCFGSLTLAESSWTCPTCGAECTSDFCPDCGTKNPSMPVCNVGDTVTLGTWGGEGIEWQVMEVKPDGTCVLMSVKGLDAKPYNTDLTDVTWETCTLRSWLNGEFYEKAFSSGEKGKIKTVTVENPDNKAYGTKGGSTTQDKVDLLSLDEVGKYFNVDPHAGNWKDCCDEALICMPADTAVKNGASAADREWVDKNQPDYSYPLKTGACWWWLRSPGVSQNYAAAADFVGCVLNHGSYVNCTYGCVRPVVCVQF